MIQMRRYASSAKNRFKEGSFVTDAGCRGDIKIEANNVVILGKLISVQRGH